MGRGGSLRTTGPEQAADLWRALVAGQWSLVDHFDHGGCRFLVLHRNEVTVRPWHLLGLRARHVVACAAMGRSNKQIACDLGVTPSAIAMCVARAAKKLGIASRVELIAEHRRARGVTK